MALLARKRPMAEGASSERAALAEAVEAHAAAVAVAAAAQGAEYPLHQAVWAADAALEGAQKALKAAKASAGDFVLAEALGTAGERPMTLRDARNALQAAEDALEDARAARDAIEAKKPALQMAVGRALSRVQAARAAVIRAEARATVATLTDELKQLHVAVSRTAAQLNWLVGAGAVAKVEEHGGNHGRVADADLRHLLDKYAMSMFQGVADPWRAWSETLLKDANAPMPGTFK